MWVRDALSHKLGAEQTAGDESNLSPSMRMIQDADLNQALPFVPWWDGSHWWICFSLNRDSLCCDLAQGPFVQQQKRCGQAGQGITVHLPLHESLLSPFWLELSHGSGSSLADSSHWVGIWLQNPGSDIPCCIYFTHTENPELTSAGLGPIFSLFWFCICINSARIIHTIFYLQTFCDLKI